MVWTRASFALAALMLLAGTAQAQEALWRGANSDGSDVVPAYAGNLSPFPMKASTELLPPPVFSEPTLTDTDRQAIEAAGILTQIRKLLKEDIAFTPDFSLVQVKAITVGPKGATALIGSTWQKQGTLLFIPMMQNNGVLDMMARLQALDPNLSEVVREEVNTRVVSKGPAAMRISSITREVVEVTDSEGKKHKLPFVSSGW